MHTPTYKLGATPASSVASNRCTGRKCSEDDPQVGKEHLPFLARDVTKVSY
jgi:hypothetical protein